jgi:large conductance mechanosensitive channel
MFSKFIEDFKSFAVKGNAIDMAIGIVVGAAFNKIINSIVSDLIMPPLGLAIGGVDFKNLEIVLKKPILDAATQITAPAVAIRYGMFLNSLVEFFIVAFSAFIAVRVMAKTMAARSTPQ